MKIWNYIAEFFHRMFVDENYVWNEPQRCYITKRHQELANYYGTNYSNVKMRNKQ